MHKSHSLEHLEIFNLARWIAVETRNLWLAMVGEIILTSDCLKHPELRETNTTAEVGDMLL